VRERGYTHPRNREDKAIIVRGVNGPREYLRIAHSFSRTILSRPLFLSAKADLAYRNRYLAIIVAAATLLSIFFFFFLFFIFFLQ